MELIQLHSFYEIVKTGSFSEASRKVFRSQSAVSHQIINLERELKVKLFKRMGKKIKLTQEGESLFNITNKFFNDLENLKRFYLDMENGLEGKLTIAATSAMVTYVLPDIIRQFLDQFPKISFKLFTCRFISELCPLVLNGEVDFGIGLKSYQEISPKLIFLPWKSFDMYLIVSKGHPLSQKKRIKLIDIVKYPHILYSKGTAIRKVIEDVCAQNKLSPNVIMEVDMAENIKSNVEKGIGVGIISSLAITKKDKERLKIFKVNHFFGQVEFGIYYRRDSYISAAMKQFIKLFAPELLNSVCP